MIQRNLRRVLEYSVISAETIRTRDREIYAELLARSRYVDAGNFARIHDEDLRLAYRLYDRAFFDGCLSGALGETPLTFRLSRRMTRAAGKCTRLQMRKGFTSITSYEIAISTTLLFQTFQGEQRPIHVNGLPCRDRLEALQRIMEHELIHLAEFLVWNDSNCSAQRFQGIARRRFAHTEFRHQLITASEHAKSKFGIRAGDRVAFHFEARRYVGIVNRITRRATILVEDPCGEPYNDGKRYRKFYVPLSMLKAIESDLPGAVPHQQGANCDETSRPEE